MLRTRARATLRHIVFSEGEDPRIVQAASKLTVEEDAHVTLLGRPQVIQATARACASDLGHVELLDPACSPRVSSYAANYLERRSGERLTLEQAKAIVESPLYFAASMVAAGDADGTVGGAMHTTAHTIQAALQCIGVSPRYKCVSSFFLMLTGGSPPDRSVLLFADCGVVPDPCTSELAEIACATADSAGLLFGIEPRVALLSYSTKGSAFQPQLSKVREAVDMLVKKGATFAFDGELQADAALVERIAAIKAPGSAVAGRANVLIFPDLNSGNIGYKLVEYFARARAIGPILQGLSKPANDLSRACLAEDVVEVALITALQAGITYPQLEASDEHPNKASDHARCATPAGGHA